MARDQLTVGGDEDRYCPAELGHAGGDLHDLIGVVGLGIAGIGFQLGQRPVFDLFGRGRRVHAASLLAFTSAKVSPVSTKTAFAPANCCQRSMATST